MNFPPDLVEQRIANIQQAWELLNEELPQFNELFSIWSDWYAAKVADKSERKIITDALVISYARMASRNGTLSLNPLCYHNETHIDDLLYRLIALSKLPLSDNIPSYGWSILSLFMSCHDLRQSEKKDLLTLIGDNEQASFQEVERILAQVDKKKIIRYEYKELLKTMIHGSTFGEGEDIHGNIYKGNLVRYILNNTEHFEGIDKQLAYLACDIDTANVAANLQDYAQSSINVYNEIHNISPNTLSAKVFFGKQQQTYFFELQKFNSKLGANAFDELKKENAPKIKKICAVINSLNDNLSNLEVLAVYQQQITENS